MEIDTAQTFEKTPNFSLSLICGALAGLTVDLALYPIDTIKTRLQSQLGFRKSGGFKAIYSGIPSVAIGSAPSSALFFVTYEGVKRIFSETSFGRNYPVFLHMIAASIGETCACFVRVPTEVVKQRAQAFPNHKTRQIFKNIFFYDGIEGLYRGYASTIAREIPFSFIEFPLWELLKYKFALYQGAPVSPWQGAACGSLAGAVAAGITTPLDVAKTRIMLSQKLHSDKLKVMAVLKDIWRCDGIKGLYAGVVPRVAWMAFGGFIFFGAYETAKDLFTYQTAAKSVAYMYNTQSFIDQHYEKLFMARIREKNPKNFDEVIEEARQLQASREARLAKEKEMKKSAVDAEARKNLL